MSVYQAISQNRLNALPGGRAIITANQKATAATNFNGRVLSAQTNGAGPNANPSRAPWTMTDFITGQRSVTQSGSTKNVTAVRTRGRR